MMSHIDMKEQLAALAEYEAKAEKVKLLKEIGIDCIICCERKLPARFINLECSHAACKQCIVITLILLGIINIFMGFIIDTKEKSSE